MGKEAIIRAVVRFIDRFNPANGIDQSLARPRLLTTFSLCVLFWAPIDAFFLHHASAPLTAQAVLFFGMAIFIAPLVQLRWGVRAAGHVASASAYLTILSASLLNGGTEFQTHLILALVPVVAVSVSGIRAAIAWTVMVQIALISMYTFEAVGGQFPMDMPIENHWIFQILAACSFVATLLVFVIMYEYSRDQLTAALSAREADLTEALDRAIQASHAKSLFLANMSHELRTPLNAILGYSELIEEELAEGEIDEAPRDVARISTSGRHLLSLINDLLDLSKIEAGKLTLENTPTPVVPLLEAVGATVAPLIVKNDNRYVCEVGDGLGTINTDPLRLRQVLLNLVSNAAKFTEGGVVTIRAQRDTEADQLLIEVTDTGIGMDNDQLERVFDAFTQGELSTSRRFGGTGLGLSIARRIVELMGGNMEVDSELGVGTTFMLRLPTQIRSPLPKAHPTPVTDGTIERMPAAS